MKHDRLEAQDFLFIQCLKDKVCKRCVIIKKEKNAYGEKDFNKQDIVINAFDLDEIAFLTGLNFNIIKDIGAKLIRMGLTNKILWKDEKNYEERYLWYLCEDD